MKVLAVFLLLTIGMLSIVSATPSGTPLSTSSVDNAEEAAARVPLEHYLKAQATGNPDLIRKAFFSEARIMAFRDGKVLNLSVEEFASRFNGKPSADETQRTRRIESLDITGNAAVARIVLDYPTIKFTDYMSLLKIDGEWKIVNKSFYAENKPKTSE